MRDPCLSVSFRWWTTIVLCLNLKVLAEGSRRHTCEDSWTRTVLNQDRRNVCGDANTLEEFVTATTPEPETKAGVPVTVGMTMQRHAQEMAVRLRSNAKNSLQTSSYTDIGRPGRGTSHVRLLAWPSISNKNGMQAPMRL